ncbi:MAG TPA: selenocysteine-specific translation elongation factor [Ilumatobacteraceae bacterium]|nr:selenocysteine-specific translation elongation factor [Ilumatobacteraceae bacterium]
MRVVATAGHVDHGKSSLVKALTGTDPDRLVEERQRGLTIDIGFAHTVLPDGSGISFVDVPGHVRFIGNMLAGVGGVDACMFVVAATEGWKPQSEEHLRILELIGLGHGIIALTMIDLVDDEWRQLQELDIRDRVAGSFLADAPIVPVSAATGAGLDDIRDALQVLVRDTPAALDRNRPRLWIDRVFAAKGSGTVVTGTLTGGAVHADQQVHVAGRTVRVRAVQSHGESHRSIGPGNRVALNLVGIEHGELRRGDAITVAAQWRPTARFDATLHALPALRHQVTRRGAYLAYIGSGEFPARVRVLGREAIAPGNDGLVRLHLAEALPLLPGDRYVLRESGRDETVGGGEILDVAPVLPASKARPDRSVDRVIAERGWVDVDDLEALTGERLDPSIGHAVASPEWLQSTQRDIAARIEAAGDLGLDLAELDDRQRHVASTLDGITVEAGRVRPASTADPLADHPFVAALLAGGVTPPEPTGIDKAQLRELVRRTTIVERDGIYFHPSTIDKVANAAARLLTAHPEGFTVAQLRDELAMSRKYALPLANELDARGITRRRGDLRVAGPRLPSVDAGSAPA